MNISIIGGGNMATSLIGGLIADGFDPKRIWVSNPTQAKLDHLHQKFGVQVSQDNKEVASQSEVVLFAVKPQVLCHVATELKDSLQAKRSLIISIAAGIREPDLQRWLGGGLAIVRCMPNTPALIGSAMTGMYANEFVSEEQRNMAESILRSVGLTLWLNKEKLMDALTALSGSGPAYFFLVMEALAHAGEVLGFKRDEARLLTLQTAIGAARMALESGEELSVLRERVTSPGGVTEKALKALESGGLRQLFTYALQEGSRHSEEIANRLGQQK